MLSKETGLMIIISGIIYYTIGFLISDKTLISGCNILILVGLFFVLPRRALLFRDFNGIGIFIIGFSLVMAGASLVGLVFEILGILTIVRPRFSFSPRHIFKFLRGYGLRL
ncbi:hypothetical protein EQH57_0432 [Dictyocoela roeselum]|nr:hypothetical protein EQH57_0432 [Dictyocoela roeselum]